MTKIKMLSAERPFDHFVGVVIFTKVFNPLLLNQVDPASPSAYRGLAMSRSWLPDEWFLSIMSII